MYVFFKGVLLQFGPASTLFDYYQKYGLQMYMHAIYLR